MITKKIAIAILTHKEVDRPDALLRCVSGLVNNTVHNSIVPIYLFSNGISDDLNCAIDYVKDRQYENFKIEQVKINETNLGCSFGVNSANEMVRDYEYVLFIEGDWIMLNGTDKNWLSDCIKHLDDNPEVDQIYLRRMQSSQETRCFYATVWFSHVSNDKFRETNMHTYTNNPVIRRNSKFYELGVLPLPSIENEVKGTEQWGEAEIQHENKAQLNSRIYKFGVFGHFDSWNYTLESQYGRGISFQKVIRNDRQLPCENCKFGFIECDEPGWCNKCKEMNTLDYKSIEDAYVESLNKD